MNRLKTSFEKAKNPLRIVLVLLVLYGLLGVYSLFKLAVTSGISPAILERSNLIVLPLIIMLFVFCYIKKTMWAFWVAASVFPTVTLYVYLQDSPTAHEWIALVIFNLIVFGYLASKLEGYENFLRFHKSLKTDNENRDVNTSEKGRLLGKNKDGEVSSHTGFSEGQSSQNALLRINDKNTKSFSFLALAAVIGIVFNFYRLYNIYQLQNGLQSVFQTELSSIFAIVFMAMFLVLYCMKSMWSWWIIPSFGPLALLFYYLQHPFKWGLFITSVVLWVLICYFFIIRKHEGYKRFLKEKNKPGKI